MARSNVSTQSQPLTSDFDAPISDTVSCISSMEQDHVPHNTEQDIEVRRTNSDTFQRRESVEQSQPPETPLQQAFELEEWRQNTPPVIEEPTDPDKPVSPQVTTPRTQSLWIWEIAACIFSLACLSSIIGVLFYEQGKPLDDWGLNQKISPTVVVSFLGTIGKSACLLVATEIVSQLKWIYFDQKPQKLIDLDIFDAASRGPWGATKLMAFKHKNMLLATCASFIILLSLFVDPFLQLIFQFPVKLIAVDGTPSRILTSQVYDPTALEAKINSYSYGASKVDSSMQAAILSPIWNVTTKPDVPCFFERCEWPRITTLGVCGSCENFTDSVLTSCRLGSSYKRMVQCNYTLPSLNATLSAQFGYTGGASDMTSSHTIWNSTWTLNARNLSETALGGFAYIKIDPSLNWTNYIKDMNSEKPSLKSNIPIAEAMSCTLRLCARTFTTPYYSNFTAGPLSGPKTPLVMSNETVPDFEQKISSGIWESPLLAELKPENSDHPSMNTTFKINYYDYNDIQDYLYQLFTVEYLSTGSVDTDQYIRFTPNLGLLLSENKNIPGLVDDISDSMTEVIRTSPNSTVVAGTGKISRTYISVRWAWLALPIAWVALTLVLLIIMIFRTRASPVPTWKSSSLPLLFYDLNGWGREEMDALDPKGVNKMASAMVAQTVSENGSRFFQKA